MKKHFYPHGTFSQILSHMYIQVQDTLLPLIKAHQELTEDLQRFVYHLMPAPRWVGWVVGGEWGGGGGLVGVWWWWVLGGGGEGRGLMWVGWWVVEGGWWRVETSRGKAFGD